MGTVNTKLEVKVMIDDVTTFYMADVVRALEALGIKIDEIQMRYVEPPAALKNSENNCVDTLTTPQ